jgi:cyclophilin family peptidyl-prolyl cis-trans isomerase
MKRQIAIIITIVILIIIAWYLFDYRSGYPKGPDQLSNISSTVEQTVQTKTPAPSVVSGSNPPINNQSSVKNFMNKITIETSKGTIVFETYDADAPNTVKNFITLANKGFYNGLIFHRVINGFMIQGGDPTGTGMSGPGYQFADELNSSTPSYKAGYVRGTVAMANSGPNTNGSQFFIMQKDNPLPHNYTIFGKVISGMDIVDAIATTKTGSNDKPVTDIVMKKVTVTQNQ